MHSAYWNAWTVAMIIAMRERRAFCKLQWADVG